MKLSVIIPQYNEAANLNAGVLQKVYDYLKTQNLEWEVIIVDDGSTDTSLELLKEITKKFPGFRITQINHAGKPNALFSGIKEAKGLWSLLIDMDQSTPINEFPKLWKYSDKYDVIIGSRGIRRHQNSILRKAAGFIFSTFRRIFVLPHIKDTQCGFKLIKTNLLKFYFPKIINSTPKKVKGWSVSAFDVELLYILSKAGYIIKEVPVNWTNKDISDTKNRKFVLESLDMIRQVFKIRLKSLFGKYK